MGREWLRKARRPVLLGLLAAPACLIAVLLAALGIVWLEARFAPERLDSTVVRPAPGDRAPDFELKTPEGQPFRLRDHLGRGPLVVEFGSFT